jgi:hypothetical protein
MSYTAFVVCVVKAPYLFPLIRIILIYVASSRVCQASCDYSRFFRMENAPSSSRFSFCARRLDTFSFINLYAAFERLLILTSDLDTCSIIDLCTVFGCLFCDLALMLFAYQIVKVL